MPMSEGVVANGRPTVALGVLLGRYRWTYIAAFLIFSHAAVAWSLRDAAGTNDDLDRYWEIAAASGRPYVTYQVEHAPLAPLLFNIVAGAAGDRADFRTAIVWTVAAADLVIALALARGFGPYASAVYLVLTLPLLPLYYKRFDLLPTAAATIGIVAHRWKQPAIAAAFLLVGVGFKLWPLPLTAFVVRSRDGALRHRGVLALLLAVVALGAGWLVTGGIDGVRQVVTLRSAGGWHVESSIGAIVAFWDHESLRIESDAWRVGQTSPTMTVALLVLATLTAFWLAWRGAVHEKRLGATWLASVTALLVLSPVLSPQFMVWLAPAAAVAWVQGARWPSLLAACATALTVLLMRGYDALLAGEPWAISVVVVRNLVLLLTFLAAAAAVLGGNAPRTKA
jgi:nitroreductase